MRTQRIRRTLCVVVRPSLKRRSLRRVTYLSTIRANEQQLVRTHQH